VEACDHVRRLEHRPRIGGDQQPRVIVEHVRSRRRCRLRGPSA
jgi:hypothetical protein